MSNSCRDKIAIFGLACMLVTGGCAGGSMGTGVRQYGHGPVVDGEERPNEKAEFGGSVLCKVPSSFGEVSLRIRPVDGAENAKLNEMGECEASFLPLSRNIELQATRENLGSMIGASFLLEVRHPSSPHAPQAQWRVVDRGTLEVGNQQSNYLSVRMHDVFSVVGSEYRIKLLLPRTKESFGFNFVIADAEKRDLFNFRGIK